MVLQRSSLLWPSSCMSLDRTDLFPAEAVFCLSEYMLYMLPIRDWTEDLACFQIFCLPSSVGQGVQSILKLGPDATKVRCGRCHIVFFLRLPLCCGAKLASLTTWNRFSPWLLHHALFTQDDAFPRAHESKKFESRRKRSLSFGFAEA